jgi:hypothetical protein
MKYDGRNSTIFGFDLREDGEGMPPPARKNLREKSVDGDGPVQARLQIPAGPVAEMGEKRVDAG